MTMIFFSLYLTASVNVFDFLVVYERGRKRVCQHLLLAAA